MSRSGGSATCAQSWGSAGSIGVRSAALGGGIDYLPSLGRGLIEFRGADGLANFERAVARVLLDADDADRRAIFLVAAACIGPGADA